MSQTVIQAHGICKKYRIGGRKEGYRTLRDAVTKIAGDAFDRVWKRGQGRRGHENILWALNGIDFEISQGEVVGIIGRNGAGKSTLLKVLSRITDPTDGEIEIKGRVGSLLEVGTGFHYELTGRENIYLNGAILGMRKREIERRFDEIVEFAEVSKFIDTPVKHYSSGMFLRLAFSVAAHLEPEILLVDEVLAVGDVSFQRKCLGKMDDVAAKGRTVIFVSHNLGALKELCHTSIVLQNGELLFRGPVLEGLAKYSESLAEEPDVAEVNSTRLSGVQINGIPSYTNASVENGSPLVLEVRADIFGEYQRGMLYCIMSDSVGTLVLHQRIHLSDLWPSLTEVGSYILRVELPPLWLAPGLYTLHFKLNGSSVSGTDERHLSERVIVDVVGTCNGLGRASLAPPLRWAVLSNRTNEHSIC